MANGAGIAPLTLDLTPERTSVRRRATVARRITHWFADWQAGMVVLLTTIRKQGQREHREIDRECVGSRGAVASAGSRTMSERRSSEQLKARQAAAEPRTDADRDAGRAAASLLFDLAQLVHDLRTGAGLTQRQLADRMGMTQSVISRLELAGRLPTLELLARIADGTGSDLRLLARRAGRDDLDVPLSA